MIIFPIPERGGIRSLVAFYDKNLKGMDTRKWFLFFNVVFWSLLLLLLSGIQWTEIFQAVGASAGDKARLNAIAILTVPLIAVIGSLLGQRFLPRTSKKRFILALFTAAIFLVVFEFSHEMHLVFSLSLESLCGSLFFQYLFVEFGDQYRKTIWRFSIASSLPTVLRKRVLEDPDTMILDGKKAFVTVMNIDFIGVAELAKKYPPAVLISELQKRLQTMRSIAQQHGGTSVGGYHQGFLCFFGDTIVKDAVLPTHADQAIQCAYEIQQACLDQLIKSKGEKTPAIVAKIAISSSMATFGNLGSDKNPTISVLGPAVNTAREILRTCGMNMIRFSQATAELLTHTNLKMDCFSKKTIKDRHNNEVQIIEFDMLYGNESMRTLVRETLSESSKFMRFNKRWEIIYPENIVMSTNAGEATLKDISSGGIGFTIKKKLQKGTVLTITLESPKKHIQQRLQQYLLNEVILEVTWNKNDSDFHGGVFRHLSESVSEALLQIILDSQGIDKEAA